MKSLRLSANEIHSPLFADTKSLFSIVVVYQDPIALEWAMGLHEHFVREFGEDLEFRCRWWKFDHLRDNATLQQAAQAATVADMIVLAASQPSDIPVFVKTWIGLWQAARVPTVSALVAMVGKADADAAPVAGLETYLKEVARAGKMDYFAKIFTISPPQGDEPAEPAPAFIPAHTEPAAEHSKVIHWGINE